MSGYPHLASSKLRVSPTTPSILRMLVFIDDSGDPGFKLTQGSTRHFVIACCVFNSPESAESVANDIRSFKSNIGWTHKSELKFSQTKKDINLSFIDQFCSKDFFVRAIMVDKILVRSGFLINNHDHFFNYAISQVLSRSNGTIENANIKIDGKGGREYRNAMETYLRSQANSRDLAVIKDVKFVTSKGDQLIQLADMVAGCVRRSFDESRSDSQSFKRAIAPMWRKENSDLWLFA